MKDTVCMVTGLIGGFIAQLFGGWDTAFVTLLMFMCIDYVTGLIVAGVFKKSNKTETGALESNAGWKGLCKKGMTLLFVLIAVRLDLVLHTTYIRDVVCIGFLANELISITENAGLMGAPVPAAITRAIAILKSKSEESKENEESEEK